MTLPIQIILIRQLAGYLSVPLFLVDPEGDLLFYNEPAEGILGRRSRRRGRCRPQSGPRRSPRSTMPASRSARGAAADDHPHQQRAASKRFHIQGMNHVRRQIRWPRSRSWGCRASSWVPPRCSGGWRDAPDPVRHPRLDPGARAGDGALRRQSPSVEVAAPTARCWCSMPAPGSPARGPAAAGSGGVDIL